jgi:hypothetical protein
MSHRPHLWLASRRVGEYGENEVACLPGRLVRMDLVTLQPWSGSLWWGRLLLFVNEFGGGIPMAGAQEMSSPAAPIFLILGYHQDLYLAGSLLRTTSISHTSPLLCRLMENSIQSRLLVSSWRRFFVALSVSHAVSVAR